MARCDLVASPSGSVNAFATKCELMQAWFALGSFIAQKLDRIHVHSDITIYDIIADGAGASVPALFL